MYRSSLTFKAITLRLISMALFIFVSWTIVGAYTIVFYGGKRIEIPDNFTVTSNAVIYETAPGLNVSFRLNSIDVPATERANNDPSGSLLRRIGAESQMQTSTSERQKATRTITNRDLEPFERTRIQSEADWEKRSKELGLPSLEETRREAARRDEALDEFLAKRRVEAEANYWREREAELRAATTLQMYTNGYQGGQNYWPNGIVSLDGGGFGQFDSRFRFGQGFPNRFNQGSPCGFNPSAACLSTHPFSLFNQGVFPRHRPIFVAPSTNGGGGRGRGVFVSPGRRH